ncbi:MAG: hypothetical protein ACXWBP_06945 [Limisphaerales bacterium]
MKSSLFFFTTLALTSHLALAQPQKPEVFAAAGDITDKRSSGTFSGDCTIEIKFTGDTAATASSVREVRITKAIDETGRDLKSDDKEHFSGFADINRTGQTVLKKEVMLKNPSRNAHVIKLIEGEASFFSPTEANGGKTIIKDALAHPGEPFDNAVLKQLKIQITYFTKETLEAAKQKTKASATAGDKIGEGLADAFGTMFSGFGSSSREKGAVDLQISDPDKRFVKIEFQDANGKTIDSQGHMSSGEFHHYGLKTAPPAGLQLVLYVATPDASVTVPFRLENVPLP